MKERNRISSTLLVLLLSLSMIFTYLPASMITYATDGIADEIAEENEGVTVNDAQADVETSDEDTPAVTPEEGGDEVTDVVEETEEEALPEEKEVITRAVKATSDTVLGFTSDTHNMENNVAATRLGTWLDKMESIYGKKVDVMSFGGDMANASASESAFWTLTQADMNQLESREVTGVYTTGNHEYSPGNYSNGKNSTTQKYKENQEGIEGSNYHIYCLGSSAYAESGSGGGWGGGMGGWNTYSSSQNSTITSYLNSVNDNKPIFIITHYPLHYTSSRTISGAGDLIDVLNAAAANGKKIIYLWGHNHTDAPRTETNYDKVFKPGDTISYSSGQSKTIQFYYGAAGCMSDSEYGTGSGSVDGKGLIVTINSSNKLTFTYYDENGNDVTTGGAFTEKDPVAATAITIVPSQVSVMERKTAELQIEFTPSDATNQGISWTSSDESIATVDANGKVRGVKQGNATITATSVNGNVSATCRVTVTENTSTGTTYVLADSIVEGGEYLIVSAKTDGNAYALRNPGATSAGASPAATQVVVAGESVETEDEDLVWTAEASGSGFYLLNDGGILGGKGGNIGIFTENPYSDRSWTYDGTYLQYVGGSYTYELYYSNGFTGRSFNSGNPSNPVYLYERSGAQAAVESVTVSPGTLELSKGRSGSLTATVLPAGASKKVSWSSSNSSIATVDSTGKVTAVGVGTARITATSDADSSKSGYSTVTVTEAQQGDGNTFVLTDSIVDGGEYLIVSAKTDGNAYALRNPGATSGGASPAATQVQVASETIETEDENIIWTAEASGSGFYLLNQGGFLGGKSGNVSIFTENPYSDRSWTYDGTYLEYVGGSYTYEVYYENGFTGRSYSGSASHPVYIYERAGAQAAVESVTVSPATLELSKGRTGTLTATVSPAGASKAVTWSSSNNNVATVDSTGKVTAVGAGTARITATSDADSSKSGYSTVTVTESSSTGTTYVLADSIVDGGEYLIVSSKTDGNAYALRNPGATSGGATPGATQVRVSGETIETEDDNLVWMAEASGSGFYLLNKSGFLGGKGGNIGIFTENPYSDRSWTYDGTYLQYVGGSYTYELYYENGFTGRSFNSGNPSHPVYIYEKAGSQAAVESVTVSPTTLELKTGRTSTLTATVLPAGASKAVTWSSSNTSVATVDSTGKVTAIGAGTARITATSAADSSKSSYCTITVTEPQPGDGDTYVLTDTLEDGQEYLIANGNTGNVYILSNEAGSARQLKGIAAEVDGDTITIDEDTAEKAVFTTEMKTSQSNAVSVWLKNGGKYLYTNNADGLRMVEASEQGGDNSGKFWHYRGDSKYLLWYFKDTASSDGYTDTSQTYKYYLECNNGVFTDNHASTTSLANTNTPKVYLFVKSTPTAVSGVSLDKTSLSVKTGKTAELTATVSPKNASNKNVTWKSSNTSVATVDSNGKVTAVAAGNATITVTTADGGYTATCNVTVADAITTTYVLTDTLEDGKEYLIANGNTGSVYIVSNEAGSSARQLKGVAAEVSGNAITIEEEIAEKTVFTAEKKNSQSGEVSVWLKNDGKYLYTNSADGLRMVEASEQGSTDNSGKVWHYRGDSKYLLWYFKDTASSDGYTDTSQTYKYYLECSNGVFTDNHASTTSLANTNTPKMYLFVKDSGAAHEHSYGAPVWTWADDYSSAAAIFTCSCGDQQTVTDGTPELKEVTPATCTADRVVTYTAEVTFGGTSYTNTTNNVTLPDTMTGHAWGDATYTWAADNKSVTATHTCANDASHVESETAAATYAVTKDPTCTAAGEGTWTSAAFANAVFKVQTKAVEIPATGHEWGEATYTWSADNKSVTATHRCVNDTSHVETETAAATYAVTTPAGCETTGVGTWTSAAFSNAAFSVQTKTVNIPATGHAWGEVTYTWSADNKSITATRTCANDASHVETETAAATYAVTKAATCDEAGEGTWTSAAFSNVAFAVQTKKVAIAATGHAWGEVTYTWSADNESVTATRRCGNNANHVESETAAATYAVTKPATCTEAGEGTWTSATFENAAFAVQTKKVAIPAADHAWGEVTYTWADDNKSVTAKRVCEHDASHVQTETAAATYAVTKPATCTEAGEGIWVSAAFENAAFEVQTKTVGAPATGHAWGSVTYTWADDYKSVTATRTCGNDPAHVETETASATYAVVTPATATTAGVGKWTSAAFTNAAFEVQEAEVAIPPYGYEVSYKWDKTSDGYKVTGTAVPYNTSAQTITEEVNATYEVTTPAECEKDGEGTWTAVFTKEQFSTQTRTESIKSTGHTSVVDPAVAATCTESGLTGGSHCSVCGKILIEQEVIPALGHEWSRPEYTWSDGNKSVTATRTCEHDSSHVQTETVAATAVVTKEATCEEKGETTYTSAAFSNPAFAVQTKTEANIDATGHDWGETTYGWIGDNSKVIATRSCRNDAEHVQTETVSATYAVTTPAGCETAGVGTWTSGTFKNPDFEVQTRTEEIPAVGHDWGEPAYTWAEDNKTATATRVCSRDDSHIQTETVNTTSVVTREPSCEEMGETTYTASFRNAAFTTQTKAVEDIAATGHDWGEPTYGWSEDNSKVIATRGCRNDAEHVQTESVSTTYAVTTPAGCETTGVGTWTSDAFKNAAFTVQTKTIDLPATGHEWEITYTWAVDRSSVTADAVCSNDNTHKKTETVSATSEVIKEATHEAEGEIRYTSEAFEAEIFTVQTLTEVIPKLGAPFITEQPEDLTVESGDTATFHVEAKGIGLTYQWQWKSGSRAWANTGLAGNKTDTLAFPATRAHDGRQYRCVITDANGIVIESEGATLTVTEDLEITAQPEDATVALGDTATFHVEAKGIGLTYQWQWKSGSRDWANTNLSGSKTDTLAFAAAEAHYGRQYRCVITDKNGDTVESEGATLTVTEDLEITSQPENVVVPLGEVATFSVKAKGIGLKYQWQWKSGIRAWANTGLSGNKTDTLSFATQEAHYGRQYRCVVTDVTGNQVESEAVTLLLTGDLEFTAQPEDVTIVIGETGTISVKAEGMGLKYQWQWKSATTNWANTAFAGNKTDTLSITAQKGFNKRQYRCVITDISGRSLISETATLTVTAK